MRRAALIGLLAAPLCAAAQPTAPKLPVGGTAFISPSGNTLAIPTTTQNSVINWGSFSVGKGATTQFAQPQSVPELNRVPTGTLPVPIGGVLMTNPAGMP